MSAATYTPLLFHALMWGSAVHHDIALNQPRPDDVNRLFHKGQTIRLLSQDLQDPGKYFGDHQIFAIFVLALHDYRAIEEVEVPNLFPSALSKLGWLNIYWQMRWSPLHLDVLYRAVEFRGGLDALKFIGADEIFS